MAREAIRKSLVLLKNGKNASDPLLPLPKKASRILVAGSHADNLGYQCGGWTITWQGFRGNNETSGRFCFDFVYIVSCSRSDVHPLVKFSYLDLFQVFEENDDMANSG